MDRGKTEITEDWRRFRRDLRILALETAGRVQPLEAAEQAELATLLDARRIEVDNLRRQLERRRNATPSAEPDQPPAGHSSSGDG